MKKKDLLNITLPDVPEELIETAQNDKYANNEFVLWNCQTTVEKSYKTRLYFGASEENGILIVRMWPRILLSQGVNKPLSVTYIDAEAEKWISMTDGKWSEALLEIKRKTDYIKRKASMDRADAFQRCWDLAVEIAHTGVYGDNRSELEDLAYEFDIFVCYTDDGIAVEDEMAYFTYR